MTRKGKLFLLFFFLLSSLWADISLIPEAQQLIDRALGQYEAKEYRQSLELFRQAYALDQENVHIKSFIDSLERLVSLENYESSSEIIDDFIQTKEEEKRLNTAKPEESDSQDYLNKEKNKEIARQERPIGEISFSFPLFYSSTGSWETDNSLNQNSNPLKGLSYRLNYYPDLFNRVIGLEGQFESYPLVLNDILFNYDEARIGVVFKNYFRELPGSYSLLGTKISLGLLYGENIENGNRVLYSSWQIELFLRDPFLYRIVQNDFSKNLGFEGKVQFSLLDVTYMLGYGGALDFKMGDFLFSSQFIYHSLMDNDVLNPSWMVKAGISYYFR